MRSHIHTPARILTVVTALAALGATASAQPFGGRERPDRGGRPGRAFRQNDDMPGRPRARVEGRNPRGRSPKAQAQRRRELREQARGRRGERSRERLLSRYDLDQDGKLSAAERAAMRADRAKRHEELLARHDTDGDGMLSVEERRAAREDRRERVRDAKDEDANGADTRKARRRQRPRERAFERFDTDGDGHLSPAEFDAMLNARRKRAGAQSN